MLPVRLGSRLLVSLALVAAPALVATTLAGDASADKPKTDKLADQLGGHIYFYNTAPPTTVNGAGWFTSNQIKKKDENSDKKWALHVMIFLKKPLDVNKLDLKVYKTDKKGNTDYVQTLEQFPSGDGRSFYFLITLKKGDPVAMEPNLSYTLKAVASTGPVAEGTIELDGKEEKIQGSGNLDFTNGEDQKKPEEKAKDPFNADATKEALKKILYEDCKTVGSPSGKAKLIIKFAKDGKVVNAAFETDKAPPFSFGTQKCIVGRFEKAKTKPFTGEDTHTIGYTVAVD